jgi:predicted RNA-binding protein
VCEFKVYLDGEKVAEDIIYASIEGRRVTVRDILGKPTVLEGAKIVEIDVATTRMVLSRTS